MPSRDETLSAADLSDAKAALVAAVRDFAGDALRDVWVLDDRHHEALYLRDDVAERIEDVAVEKYLDNERYGFVTRDTYNRLHYSEFRYTHRGFDSWELFRTFLVDPGNDGDEATRVGVLCSVDRQPGGYDFSELNDTVQALHSEYAASDFAPAPDD